VISPRYFQTMGIPLLAGRDFDARDRLGSPGTVILNEAAAKRFFPGENPIGKHMKVAWAPLTTPEIIGVVGDIRHNGLDTAPDPCLFLSQAQAPTFAAALVVRTSQDPAAAVAAVREAIRSVDPSQGVLAIKPMEQLLSDSMSRPKLDLTVLGIFGLLALILASIGIYAVISYSVEQRRREMGIRVALGAIPRSVSALVLREGLFLALTGIAAGSIAALGLTRYLRTLLFEVRPTDPLVFAGVAAILAAAAAAGCYFPARRATRVDPALVLREE